MDGGKTSLFVEMPLILVHCCQFSTNSVFSFSRPVMLPQAPFSTFWVQKLLQMFSNVSVLYFWQSHGLLLVDLW